MIDNQMETILRRVALIVVGIVILFFGIGIGSIGKTTSNQIKSTTNDAKIATQSPTELTREMVNDFLIAYYTKTDLGENQNRYKPFMTESMYQKELAKESEPAQLVYQGYIVNQEFQKAIIFIDEVNHLAYATVTYSNLQRQEKDSDVNAFSRTFETTLKLTYTIQDNKLLINDLSEVTITDKIGG
ncbi:TPA: hypothetical protein ACGO3M_000506 [Streptococcus suis]